MATFDGALQLRSAHRTLGQRHVCVMLVKSLLAKKQKYVKQKESPDSEVISKMTAIKFKVTQ